MTNSDFEYRREQLGGTCLIVGAVAGAVTMAFHPTSAMRARAALLTHAIAIGGTALILYGCGVLTWRLSRMGRHSGEIALVFFGISTLAALIAATASGILAPAAARLAEADKLSAMKQYTFLINQSFAKVMIVTGAVAIGVWSTRLLGIPQARASGVWGSVVALATLVASMSGHLSLGIHGFGAIVLGNGIWFVLVGRCLQTGFGEQLVAARGGKE